MTPLLIINILLVGILLVALQRLFWYRRRVHRMKSTRGKLPIKKVLPEQFDVRFSVQEFGYTRECEVVFIGRSHNLPGGTSDREGFILSVFAKSARCIFEFGTCTGKTTYLLAKNSPAGSRVTTLTLAPDQTNLYTGKKNDDESARKFAITESAFKRFVYSGSDVESKITQLYNDSKRFDENVFIEKCDLLFVDGSHAYSYVANDTEKALRMVAEYGIIVWHDYGCTKGMTEGVTRYLNELSKRLPLVWIEDTSLVVYRHDKNRSPH